jgi:hypothetical protein
LGTSVAGVGDIDSDGYDDIIVGAARLGGSAGSGLATVYSALTGLPIRHWTAVQYGGHFGISVADAGDVDGDGTPDQIVGAPWAGFKKTGAACVFSGATGALLYQLEGEHTRQQLGIRVSGASDVNQDGFSDLLVASGLDTFFASNEYGAISCYSGKDGTLLNLWTESPADDYIYAAAAAAGQEFKVLFSASGGVGPSTYGIEIPLTRNAMVVDTFQGIYPVSSSGNLQGLLDSSGAAQAFLDVPAGQLPAFSTIAIPIEITP